MRKPGRIGVIVFTSIVALPILLIVGYLWAIHSFNKAFANVNLTPIEVVLKKRATDLVVIRRSVPTTKEASGGYLHAYEKDPAAFQSDAKLFDAWTSEIQVAASVLENTPRGTWVNSTAESACISREHKLDPWGHPLCLLRRGDTVVVISGGPKAPTAPVCGNIKVSEDELGQLPRKKLLESPFGNLILVMSKD